MPTGQGQVFATGEPRWGRVAIDDVLLLANRQLPVLGVVVTQGRKQQRTAAPGFFLDIHHGRGTRCLGIHPQRLVEFHASARPHPIAIVDRWQQVVVGRVAVQAEPGFFYRGLKECPVPERGQWLARFRGDITQGCGDALDQARTQMLGGVLAAPDPGGVRGITQG
ncbi:hypothetical protein D3C76_1172180 [compost metagenome]